MGSDFNRQVEMALRHLRALVKAGRWEEAWEFGGATFGPILAELSDEQLMQVTGICEFVGNVVGMIEHERLMRRREEARLKHPESDIFAMLLIADRLRPG